jgi:hypothetical protein
MAKTTQTPTGRTQTSTTTQAKMPDPAVFSSCITKEPFVKLEDIGKASILNYNLPQATCFSITTYVKLDLQQNHFKPACSEAPKDNFWDTYQNATPETISNAVNINTLGSASSVIANPGLIKTIVTASATSQLSNAARSARILNPNASQIAFGEIKVEPIQDAIKNNLRPVMYQNFYGTTQLGYVAKPQQCKPEIAIALHTKTCSYLGDYGAGKTVKTFSLLPGERTTISIRNFTHKEIIQKKAEHVLDSFSESCANEFESQLTLENNTLSNINTSNTTSNASNWEAGGGLAIDLTKLVGFPLGIGGGGGGGGSSSGSTTINTNIETSVKNINNTIDKTVSKADAHREIEINTETTSTSISETEETTMRMIENINKSRVLNFVFRQLLQEYFTITYLDDVSIIYSNGYPETRKTVKLSQLDALLNEVILDIAQINAIKNSIFTYLCNIFDYTGTAISFIEGVTEDLGNCIDSTAPHIIKKYIRKRKGLTQTYKDKTVNGIILDVKHRITRTSALVVDSLLGQGEALDCYNMKLQNEATISAKLNNDVLI